MATMVTCMCWMVKDGDCDDENDKANEKDKDDAMKKTNNHVESGGSDDKMNAQNECTLDRKQYCSFSNVKRRNGSMSHYYYLTPGRPSIDPRPQLGFHRENVHFTLAFCISYIAIWSIPLCAMEKQ